MTAFPIRRLLVANRGEIAVRIFQTCRLPGISTVAVAAPDDRGAFHTRVADEAYEIESYVDSEELLRAASDAGAQVIHPGYGFLAERSDFASRVINAGLLWVGPSPETLETVADKIDARRIANSCGIPTLDSGTADELGFPLMVKAAAGGGGRGMRVVTSPDQLDESMRAARREAQASFGDDRVYFERYLPRPRHIEVQVLGDGHGELVQLGERDCSLQRRHQKVLEESPAPNLDPTVRKRIADAALAIAREVGYVGAGTVEFLVSENQAFFLEVNARIQVEHPVTELVAGVDLVEEQLRIAAGERLAVGESEPSGHAIEARIYAEDPRTFLPQTGVVRRLVLPTGVRVDRGIDHGDQISLAYDPMIAKIITSADDREQALSKLSRALRIAQVDGVTSNLPFLRWLTAHPEIVAGAVTTHFLSEHSALSKYRRTAHPWNAFWRLNGTSGHGRLRSVPLETVVFARRAKPGLLEQSNVVAPMPGTVLRILVAEGDRVATRQTLVVLEAMKMETPLHSPHDARVSSIQVAEGDQVDSGTILVQLDE